MTTDGVTPRCVWCGDPVDLAAHVEHLDAHQPLIERRREIAPDAGFRAAATCGPCKETPGRMQALLEEHGHEVIMNRMMGRS